MADVSSTFSSLSSTEGSNNPAGSTNVGTGLDDNIRMLQALLAAWRDQTAWGTLTLTSVSGTNTITATLAAAGSVTFGPTALTAGMKFLLTPAATNTGATTIAITSPNGASSLGTKNIFSDGAACVGGELKISVPVLLSYDGTQFNIIGRRFFKQPTRQVLTSGTAATYTTPAGTTRINVRMVGGGGGGAGSGTTPGAAAAGTASTWSGGSLSAGGGAGGGAANGSAALGGTSSNGDVNISGGSGDATDSTTSKPGGRGGSSHYGGGGAGTEFAAIAGRAAVAIGGGGGGAGAGGTAGAGGGGGAGGYCEKLITAPAATYTYTVGAFGAGGTLGTGGGGGGAGAAGIIIVDEYYE